MATYVNNLRLTELATGEGSGTWGTTTNTNLELIGQALGFGTRAIANASTDNITIADGVSDADRAMYLKLTGGGQACTVTILPNTTSKVWWMENATSYTLTFTCGSGANVAVLAGETKCISTDGLGSGGAVYDVLTDVNLAGTTKVDDLVVGDALTVGGTLGVTGVLTTTAATVFNGGFASNADSTLGTDKKVQFRDAAIYINSSVDGQLDIVADTEIQIAATTIDINGAINASGEIIAASLDISGNVDVDGITNLDVVDIDGAVQIDAALTVGVDDTGYDVKFYGATGGKYMLWNQATDTLDVVGSIEFDSLSGTGAVAITDIKDEDNMASDSATALATQQSIKAYVDAQVGTVDTLAEVLANGNTTGGTDLDISIGDDLTTLTAGTSNLGVNAGNSIIAGGNYNTVVGDEAGTALTTGDYNTALGYQAGNSVTTGPNNTLMGGTAGLNLTTGGENVAIGYGALYTDDVGSHSTAVGVSALQNQNYASATDSYNTAVGFSAGLSVTTGTNNTLIGGLAGDAITTASNNSALGFNSFSANTTGENNVALGSYSLNQNTTAFNNTAVGHFALTANTTGTGLVAVGANALDANTTASNNVGIGLNAAGGTTTGADNIAIGTNSLLANTTGGSNVSIGTYALTLTPQHLTTQQWVIRL
jgi:hypothetical protein